MRTVTVFASALVCVLTGVSHPPIARAVSQCDLLGGNVQSGRICHARDEQASYVVDIRYDTDYPDDGPVTDYLIRNRDDLINTARTSDGENLPYAMTVTSETFRSGQQTRTTVEYGQPWHGTITLVLKNFREDNKSALTKYKSFTFDYDANRPVTFDNLFVPGSNPIDAIYPAVATEMERQQVARKFRLSTSVGRNPDLYRNFAITDDSVIFFFDTSQIMPEEAGYFFAPVSRAKLPPLQP